MRKIELSCFAGKFHFTKLYSALNFHGSLRRRETAKIVETLGSIVHKSESARNPLRRFSLRHTQLHRLAVKCFPARVYF